MYIITMSFWLVNYHLMLNMASPPVFVGNKKAPRYVFIVDKVGAEAKSPIDVGLDDGDLLLKFDSAKLEELATYFEADAARFDKTEAFIFLNIGQNNISHLADEVLPHPLSPTIENYFPANGPREIPGDDFVAVVPRYEELVRKMCALFQEALIFSSAPAARRSKCGFAVRQAMMVAKRVDKTHGRHHHFSLLERFHGRRTGKVPGEGGRFPLKEEFFLEDGVTMTRAALAGCFVRAYAFVKAVSGVGRFLKEADHIEGVKMYF